VSAAFNPYGLHAWRIPEGLAKHQEVSWAAKVLYAYLAFRLGKPRTGGNFCNPGLKTMAEAMNLTEDHVTRLLKELTKEGFLQRRRRGRDAAEIVFLPHPSLVSNPAKMPGQSDSDPANLPGQNEAARGAAEDANAPTGVPAKTAASIRHSCGPDPAFLQPQSDISAAPIRHFCSPPYKEENTQENTQENVQENPLRDDSLTSRKNRAKVPELVHSGPNPNPAAEAPSSDLLRLRAALEAWAPGIPEALTDATVEAVAKAAAPRTVAALIMHLDGMPAVFQPGGKKAAHSWGFFISTARSFAAMQPQIEPTAELCRHGLPWGVDCLDPATVEEMSSPLEVPAPLPNRNPISGDRRRATA